MTRCCPMRQRPLPRVCRVQPVRRAGAIRRGRPCCHYCQTKWVSRRLTHRKQDTLCCSALHPIAPLLLEALITQNWFATAWNKWHLRLTPTIRTNGGVHLACARRTHPAATIAIPATITVPAAPFTVPTTAAIAVPAAARRFARLPTTRAARWLVRESLLCVELLLTCSKYELCAAVATRQCFVGVAHRSLRSFGLARKPVPWV